MPEGDVLARLARLLTRSLADQVLVRSDLRWPEAAGADFTGRRSTGTVSYGKHLLTRFDDGRTLHTHMRMDGVWRARTTRTPPEPLRQPRVRAVLATQQWTCVGEQLGMLTVLRTRDEARLLSHLGPNLMAQGEALDAALDLAAANFTRSRGRPAGEVLLDQSVAAGIGTIYLAETLWRHQISPWRMVELVPDARALYATAAALMRRSADAPTLTATGSREQSTHVHGREGLACARCGTPIAMASIGPSAMERPAFHCPACQPG
ncbi:DNA-formamidopyrimidine glycosylase family protein [Ruania zhangjianzhongii]|uniref:DNA-formamidopyrimidine glycosylase family protein n=1 Tax=Ruania zhangjianzhongii TaxID=2603206 RepID=UPI0011C9B31E|nr:DNA-formamidopyrimidine glycosylase family protein [Ruania zhangjianzhongii]